MVESDPPTLEFNDDTREWNLAVLRRRRNGLKAASRALLSKGSAELRPALNRMEAVLEKPALLGLMRRIGKSFGQLERDFVSDPEVRDRYEDLLGVVGLKPATARRPSEASERDSAPEDLGREPVGADAPEAAEAPLHAPSRPGEEGVVSPARISPSPSRPKPSDQLVSTWFRQRVKNWPDDQKAPSEAADWKAIRKHFASGLSRNEDFRLARKQETPDAWRKQGQRRLWEVERRSID